MSKTFEFSDSNGAYGAATIILSANNFDHALEIMTDMVKDLDSFSCDDQEGEDEDE